MSTKDLTKNHGSHSENSNDVQERLERLNREIYESLNDTIVVGRIHQIDIRKGFLGRIEKLSFTIKQE